MSLPTPSHAEKPLDFFVSDPVDESTEEFANLVESVRQYGILEPPICVEDGEVIAGRHRIAAARKAGLKTIPAQVYPKTITPTDKRCIKIGENLQRKNPPAREVYADCKALRELNPGWRLADMAAHINKSIPMVSLYLNPDKLEPEPLADFMDSGLTFDQVQRIVASKDQLATFQAIKNGASRDETRRANRQKDADAVRAARIKVPLPSGTEIVASGNELSLDELIEAFAEAQKLVKKARDEGLTAKTAQRVWREKVAG